MKSAFTLILIVHLFQSFSQTFNLFTPSNHAFTSQTVQIDYKSNGNVFASTSSDTLIVEWDGISWQLFNYSDHGFLDNNGSLKELVRGYNDEIIFIQDSAISIFDGTNTTFMSTSNSELLSDFIEDVEIDTAGIMYIAYANDSISRVDAGTWTHTGEFTGSLAELNNISNLNRIFIDRETNDVWMLSFQNAVRIKDGTATFYNIGLEAGAPFYSGHHVRDMTVTDDGKVWFACAGTNTATGGIITFDGSTWSHLNTLNSTFYDDYILGIGSYGNTVVIPDHHDLFIYNGSNWTQIGSWFTDLPWNAGPYSEMIEVGQKIYVCSDKGILEINGPALTTVEEKNQSIYLYPNPSYEIININDPNQVIIDYKIFDLSGRIVCESTELFIPVHQFDSGEYIIKFNCVDGNELIRSLHVVH